MTHARVHPERMKDPVLGDVWVLVGCDWCGAKGRYKYSGTAHHYAHVHNAHAHRTEVEKNDRRLSP